MNLLNLSAICHDKASSVQFLQQRGLLHNPRICTNNHRMVLSLTDTRDRWRCSRQECRENVQVRSNTWLQGSKLSFRQIVLFIYCWSKELTTINFCENELLISKSAVIDWNMYLREVCADTLLRNPVVIGGPNTTVEIDESLFTRRKNNIGMVLPQQWVFGGICRETGDCFMFAVPDRTAATLMPIITQSILPGTTIMSDQWQAYNGIAAAAGMGFTHETVNHSVNFVDPNTGANTQRIERSWKAAKERNKRHNGTHRHMLDSYLCEYMWRNRVKRRHADLFDTIVNDIVTFWPPG
jgi:transposase-like protein